MVFIVVVGLFTQKPNQFNLAKFFPIATQVPTKTMTIGSKTIQVETANTESARQKGLGGRTSLPADSGMLFIFDSKGVTPTFWMKDMQIPLDMVWISGNKIVKIDKKIPAPPAGTQDAQLKIYPAGRPIDYVLEVNGGFCDTGGIKIGDAVTLPTL